jgi:hypothetical protein
MDNLPGDLGTQQTETSGEANFDSTVVSPDLEQNPLDSEETGVDVAPRPPAPRVGLSRAGRGVTGTDAARGRASAGRGIGAPAGHAGSSRLAAGAPVGRAPGLAAELLRGAALSWPPTLLSGAHLAWVPGLLPGVPLA